MADSKTEDGGVTDCLTDYIFDYYGIDGKKPTVQLEKIIAGMPTQCEYVRDNCESESLINFNTFHFCTL